MTDFRLLSDPLPEATLPRVTRRQFILGKYLGIMVAIAVLFVILSLVFFGSLWWKAGYEARDGHGGEQQRVLIHAMTRARGDGAAL